ncbi:hypothetical protein GURASL_13530 [Geotalea uraniireducens]|uniref:Phage head morphogenesis domain-containing protein n=1 Tax=Geotalea uraniireducens TaxID=351604 RepID=A0ABM8EJ05_9BACT|nr:DUF935 family protein [Geotalea uraniireducens]BDV42430.1 hypothetical protein GURASL_13530 [Geotalea uraniireducens]
MKHGLYLPDGTFMRFNEATGTSSSLSEEIAVRSRSADFFAIGNLYLPNPDPVLKAQGKDIQVYTDLMTDDRVSGSMTNRINATLALDWQIDKGKSSKSRQAKAVKDTFDKLPLNRIIESIIRHARAFGYGPHEIIWGQRDGLTVPVDIVAKPPRWFVFSQLNELRFRSRDHLMDGEELPPRKFICPTNESSYDNPYGIGLNSRCFWPVAFKKGGWRFRIQYGEKFGQVWPIGKLPRTATPEQVNDLLERLVGMIQDGCAVIPDDGSVDLKESNTKGATSDMYSGIISDANSAISTVWLGHAGAGEAQSGDKFSKDTTAITVRRDLRDADKSLVEETLNQVINWTCEVNWSTAEGAPRFSLWEEEEVDQAQAERDQSLTQSLARSGLKLTRVYYQRTYNLEEEDIEAAPAKQPSPGPVTLPPRLPAQADVPAAFAEPADVQDSADVVAQRLDEAAAPIIERWLATLKNEVDVAGNLVDLRDDLLKAANKLNLADLAVPIRDALLVSRLAGRAEILDEIAASDAGASFAEIERMHAWSMGYQFAEPVLRSALNLPFQKAVEFFRSKVSIPTEKWNDLFLDQHSQGFMIAGAIKGDLISDLRDAVDQAISAGITLAEFRRQWDQIVERHGWQYNGGRNWRTRIVYETNTRQAYNAGRWQQATDPDVLKTRPYLIYRHGDSIHPRVPHMSWDGTCLPADDPWWGTHTPQNGWGCKCKIFSGGERDVARLGDKAKRTAPNDGTYTWIDKQGRSFEIPNGIDPGFQYNPGAAAGKNKQILEDRISQLPADIATRIRAEIAQGAQQ